MDSNVSVKFGRYGYKVIVSNLKFKSSYKNHIYNDKKYDSSISRAKNTIFDLVYNNDFKFFVTFTLNSKHDRFDLSKFRLNLNDRIKYMKKRGFSNLFYVLIPELHKDGAIHFHGFLSEGFAHDMYYNDNGFLSLSSFDSLGFTSISKIKNYEACCKYILKYVNKDMCEALKRSTSIFLFSWFK